MPATAASIETVIALFAREGYARAEPANLQPVGNPTGPSAVK